MANADAMKSMKLTKREAKKSMGCEMPSTAADSGPKYPWGLNIELRNEALTKLGLSADDFRAGEQVTIKCTADVSSVRKVERMSGDPEEEVCFQITKMAVA